MPGPGDRDTPDDDDQIGFSNPASLQGRRRDAEPEPTAADDDLFAPRPVRSAAEPPPRPAPSVDAPASPASPAPPVARAYHGSERRRTSRPTETPEAFRLYTVYALMLFTVPTFGVAGVVALVAVWKRARMGDGLAESHAVYQKRTLLAAGGAALVGIVLMAAPFALGVPILFLGALWLILRTAWGVWLLKSGRGIADPRGWWIR